MGGVAGQQGGGDMSAAIGRMIGQQGPWEEPTPLPSPTPNPFGNPDPNVFINREPAWAESGADPSNANWFTGSTIMNPWLNPNSLQNWTYGTQNPFGAGNTMVPTYWNPQGIPYGIPTSVVGADLPPSSHSYPRPKTGE